MQLTVHFLSGSLPMSPVFTTFVAKLQTLIFCCLRFHFVAPLSTEVVQLVSVECLVL